MRGRSFFLSMFGFLFFVSTLATAQVPVMTAEQVHSWLDSKRAFLLIDARPAEEYRQAHIPGAINIPADRMKADAERLPKVKSTPIIFYCRGEG